MSRCSFTLEAERDLDGICEFIGQDNLEAAARYIRQIRQKCMLLGQNPQIGKRRDALLPGVRSFPAGQHMIFYRIAGTGVQVLRVLHGAQDIPEQFQD